MSRLRITEDEELALRFRVTALEEFQSGVLLTTLVAVAIAVAALVLTLRTSR
jgi:hypothetical protein